MGQPSNLYESILDFKTKEKNLKPVESTNVEYLNFQTEVSNLFKNNDYDFIINKITELNNEKEKEIETLSNPNLDQATKLEVEERLKTINANISLYIEIDSLIFQYSFCLEKHFLRSKIRFHFLRYFTNGENKSVFNRFFFSVLFPLLFTKDLDYLIFDTEIDLLINKTYPNYRIEDFNLELLNEALLNFFKPLIPDKIGNPSSELQVWAISIGNTNYEHLFSELDFRLLLLIDFFKTRADIDQKSNLNIDIEKHISQYYKEWGFRE